MVHRVSFGFDVHSVKNENVYRTFGCGTRGKEDVSMDSEGYVVSSLVVDTLKGSADEVSQALSALEGVEVHEVHPDKLVVTIEAETSAASADIASTFMDVPGVVGISLIYVNFEEDASLNWKDR